jgi:hypothetical protein
MPSTDEVVAATKPRCPRTPTAPRTSSLVTCDLPGVSPEAIELDVERNVLTVTAERRPTAEGENVERQVAERPLGVFSRQLLHGEALDTEHAPTSHDAGVLTLRIRSPSRRSLGLPLASRTPCRLVGIDPVDIDNVDDPNAPAHTLLLVARFPVVEHFTGLDQLPPGRARFTAIPTDTRLGRLRRPRLRQAAVTAPHPCVGARRADRDTGDSIGPRPRVIA